jgi:8-oxo-dGTP diphosphatase
MHTNTLSLFLQGGKMQPYNVILVFHWAQDELLMCLRNKNPYKGLYNLVGGKIEACEDELSSAYRELKEETGIERENIHLTHLMDFIYPLSDCRLVCYVGRLTKEVSLVEEANKLYWISLTSNFFDTAIFAGDGNIGHMVAQVNRYREELFP